MRDARFRELVGTRTAVITWPPDHAVNVTSHNRLLDYPWGDGVKTGATSASGMVLVGSGRPGLVPLIVVTMHEPTRDQEERDAVRLFKWGSAQYARRTFVAAGERGRHSARDRRRPGGSRRRRPAHGRRAHRRRREDPARHAAPSCRHAAV